MFEKFPELHSDNLVLNEINIRDQKVIFNMYSSHEMMKYYGKQPMKSINEAIDQIERLAKGFNNREVIRWGIRRKADNELIGTCGFHNWVKEFFRAEIGFVISKDFGEKVSLKKH